MELEAYSELYLDDTLPPNGNSKNVIPPPTRVEAMGRISRSEYIEPLSENRSLAIFSVETITCFFPRMLI
jgi:hypothetical protein